MFDISTLSSVKAFFEIGISFYAGSRPKNDGLSSNALPRQPVEVIETLDALRAPRKREQKFVNALALAAVLLGFLAAGVLSRRLISAGATPSPVSQRAVLASDRMSEAATYILLWLSALGAGIMNAVAGGGTMLTLFGR